MRKTAKFITKSTRVATSAVITVASAAVLMGSLALAPVTTAVAASAVQDGKKLVFNKKKGNCIACHAIKGSKMPGNIGPPLVYMKARFPDKSKLRARIWDATKANPNTTMPPFGRHKILSGTEIDKIAEYIFTL